MKRICSPIIVLVIFALGINGCKKLPLAETTLLVPIAVDTTWPDQVTSELTPAAIELLIKGAAEDLTALEQSALTYTIQRQPDRPGLHQISIDTALLPLPENITVIKTTPATVTLKTEAKIAKFIKITPRLEGTPATGWSIAKTTVEPATANITGGESILASLEEIFTDPITIDNIAATLDQPDVRLIVPEGVSLTGPEKVVVTVHPKADRTTRTWPAQPVALQGNQYLATVHPNRVTLTVRGPQATLDQLDGGFQVDIFIDVTGLEPGVYVRRAVIRLPLDVTLIKAEPKVFSVTISDQPKS